MQIVICDDEKKVQDIIARRVKKYYPDCEILCCSSGQEVLMADWEADILFLDIQMPEINGMETARELRRRGKKTILIFITALEEYVFQAFDVGAFHYLVKPFSEEKFQEVLKAAVRQYKENQKSSKRKEEKYLMVQKQGSHLRIKFSDIVYAEVYNRKVILHMHINSYSDRYVSNYVQNRGTLKNDKMTEEIVYYGRLSELEAEAGDDFYRSHRSYLVHFKYVEKYDASFVYLENGGRAMMAKKNYPEFVKKFLQYNKRIL